MGALSTPEHSPAPGARRGRRWVDAIAFVGVPAALAVVFAAVLIGEHTGIDLDLQLAAPYSARPGGAVALRGLVYDLRQSDGPPRRVRTTAEVQLRREGSGRRVARTLLRPTPSLAMEGVVQLPAGVEGELRIDARVALPDGREAHVVRPLRVEDPPRPYGEVGRAMSPLRRYTPFPIEVQGAAPAPALDLRVPGGACVPEVRCDLLVLMGAPASELRLEAPARIEVGEVSPAAPTAGIAGVSVVVHGGEAEVRAVALRDGRVVARRRVRLPVLLGGFATRVDRVLVTAPARPRLDFAGVEGRRPIVVEGFHDGIWERTGSVSSTDLDGPVPIPFAPLGPGLWRLQAHADGADASASAVRYVWVGQGEDARSALASLATRVRALDWDDPFAAIAPSAGDAPETAAAFMLALAELDVRPAPPPSSSRVEASLGVTEKRDTMRWAGALAFVLAGLCIAAILLRRGLGAADEARRLMAAAGVPSAKSRRTRLRMTLTVVAIVAAVASAFVLAAMMLMARALL